MEIDELLRRLSATLRADVGPAVGDEFTRTQAFMASVILEKVARQLALAPAHNEAEREDLAGLHRDLAEELVGDTVPAGLASAVEAARAIGTVASLGPVVTELHRWGVDDEPVAAGALDLIRAVLRADIDRRMEIAR